MRICYIWDGDYPWDVRVEKVGKSLVSFGHEVHLVCRNERRRSREEEIGGMNVHRLPSVGSEDGSWLRDQLNAMVNFPLFFNPLWISRSLQIARRISADIILIRDLPLAMTAVAVGKVLRIPVVMDMAEDYPEQLRGYWRSLHGFRLRNLFVRNPWVAKCYEYVTVRCVDHIIVVVEESKARLRGLGVPSEKISIVSNTPSLNTNSIIASRDRTEFLGLPESSYRLGYVGLLDNERGLEVALGAMPAILDSIPDATLIIAGSGNYESELRSLAGGLGIDRHVLFLGWLDPERAKSFISDCDVGIVPHHAVSSWNNTIPNKLFDYMLKGEPVLVSSAAAQARIVREEDCGLVFKDRDVGSFARQAILLSDQETRKKYGVKGQRAVREKYNWERDSKTLGRIIQSYGKV